MGRFFSSVQIKNNGSKDQFIRSFCNVMKKRGLATCSEDEASISYIFAFSESGKWVTLTSEEYRNNPKRVKDDAVQTAAEMNTSSFSMDVVDSDWAYIELYTGTDIHDTVVAGRTYFSEEQLPKGRRECWKQLLVPGKTWEQLYEIWNKNEVFVEDALCEAASVLGIEPKYMVSDYEDFNSEADEDTNIVPLFFKKKTAINGGDNNGIDRMKNHFSKTAQLIKEGLCGYSQKDFENECNMINESRLRQISIRERYFKETLINPHIDNCAPPRN